MLDCDILDSSQLTETFQFLFVLTFTFKTENLQYEYRTRAIITRGLYTFYPIFEGQTRFLRSFFHKILTLRTVSIQERFQIKSGL